MKAQFELIDTKTNNLVPAYSYEETLKVITSSGGQFLYNKVTSAEIKNLMEFNDLEDQVRKLTDLSNEYTEAANNINERIDLTKRIRQIFKLDNITLAEGAIEEIEGTPDVTLFGRRMTDTGTDGELFLKGTCPICGETTLFGEPIHYIGFVFEAMNADKESKWNKPWWQHMGQKHPKPQPTIPEDEDGLGAKLRAIIEEIVEQQLHHD
jgi:hypothetical protein